MANRTLLSIKFLVILIFCYSTFADARTEHKSENGRNNIDYKQPITVPPINIEKLSPEYQPMARQLQSFATKYANRANEIAKLPLAKQAKAGDKLEKDFNEQFKKLQPKMNRLQTAPRNAHSLGGGGSIYSHLNGFLTAINELPVRIHCLIHDCSSLISETVTQAASQSESDEDSNYY